MYLTNVNTNTCPFQIIPDTHISHLDIPTYKRNNNDNTMTRFTDEIIEDKFKDKIEEIIGGKGTCILVDTSNIHRSKPIINGNRMSLTNYYYDFTM